MKYNLYGQAYATCNELADLLYSDPELDLTKFYVKDPSDYNHLVEKIFYVDFPKLKEYVERDYKDIEEFDSQQQNNWHMPSEYRDMDIAQWLLDQCRTEPELQRIGEELLLYQERDLFNLLRYLKYMIDTFRKNNIVWGLGRGSSVASYALYLIGVHKINSIYYDLDIGEFLR